MVEEAARLRQQESDRATAFTLPPGADGSGWNESTERVVKKGDAHDEDIGFMERTMHFGLFCIAIMYFRARWLFRQQKECASNFKLGWNIDTSVPVHHRKDVSQSSHTTQAGHQRVKVRWISSVELEMFFLLVESLPIAQKRASLLVEYISYRATRT